MVVASQGLSVQGACRRQCKASDPIYQQLPKKPCKAKLSVAALGRCCEALSVRQNRCLRWLNGALLMSPNKPQGVTSKTSARLCRLQTPA